jgi:DNA-binding transcriptional ArsR family regulator
MSSKKKASLLSPKRAKKLSMHQLATRMKEKLAIVAEALPEASRVQELEQREALVKTCMQDARSAAACLKRWPRYQEIYKKAGVWGQVREQITEMLGVSHSTLYRQ